MGPMGGLAGRGVACRVAVPVGMAAGRARATAAHWLSEQACWGGAGCPAAGLGCCRGPWCAFRRVLHASSELRTGGEVCYL